MNLQDMAEMINELKQKASDYFDWMVEIRRHLHRYPEVSYKEYETTDYIVSKLGELGIDVEKPLETGCVGILEGKQTDSSRTIALRADIDALDMTEEGDHKKEFLSRNPGAAHCCGHDAHTANLLGTAKILTDYRERMNGKVLLIFQPGEEKLPGGARLLCESGFLDRQGVDEIYGLHTSPGHKPGEVAIRSGPMMARPDEFEIELIGKGGHAASPHQAVDTIVMAAEAVTRFQTIVSRHIDPTEPAVVTVGKIEGGSAYNVIPGTVSMIGTVRTFSRETSHLIRDRMEAILKGITESYGGSYEFRFNEGYPAVINEEKLADNVRLTAEELFGPESVLDLEKPLMAAEDFAFYQEIYPGAYFLLGSGSDETGSTWSWHHPRYNVDERCFLTGAPLMAAIALFHRNSSS